MFSHIVGIAFSLIALVLLWQYARTFLLGFMGLTAVGIVLSSVAPQYADGFFLVESLIVGGAVLYGIGKLMGAGVGPVVHRNTDDSWSEQQRKEKEEYLRVRSTYINGMPPDEWRRMEEQNRRNR